MDQTISQTSTIKGNLAPEAFHRMAKDFYKCKQGFRSEYRFSPVPYFLLCRAIELSLKARHLRRISQGEVKSSCGHDLLICYDKLKPEEKMLSQTEREILAQASWIYNAKKHEEYDDNERITYQGKGFEYLDPQHTYRAYRKFPDLEQLDAIASKIIVSFVSELEF